MTPSIVNEIETIIQTHPIVIFMKGTVSFPLCGFSAKACQVLKACGAEHIHSVDVLSESHFREAIKAYTQWPTLPQIFINGAFLGGCDIATELAEDGSLSKMITATQSKKASPNPMNH